MLPFLKQKKQQDAGIATVYRAPDTSSEDSSSDSEGLEAAAQDLMTALSSGDTKKAAAALKAAFEICDSLPHEEGPHTNDE